MALLWREQLRVGNDLIDSDHQYLIDLINKAEVSMKANRRPELVLVLDELARYGASHFDREELVARAVGYPKADELHHSHLQLLTSLAKFKSELGESLDQATVTRFTLFLRNWLVEHVIKEDLLMKPWIGKFSPRFDPRA